MQVEIYVILTEIRRNKLNLKVLENIRDEISQKIGGITILPMKQGEWWNSGKKYVDYGEIWRLLEDPANPIDFQWLKKEMTSIKGVTYQKSQLYTTNTHTKAWFI